MMCQPFEELFRLQTECFGHTEKRDHRNRAPCLDHLSMANAKAIGKHILLAELSVHPVRSDAMAERAEVPLEPARNLSARTHLFRLRSGEQKHHEQKDV